MVLPHVSPARRLRIETEVEAKWRWPKRILGVWLLVAMMRGVVWDIGAWWSVLALLMLVSVGLAEKVELAKRTAEAAMDEMASVPS